jgi:hypothetical protein
MYLRPLSKTNNPPKQVSGLNGMMNDQSPASDAPGVYACMVRIGGLRNCVWINQQVFGMNGNQPTQRDGYL